MRKKALWFGLLSLSTLVALLFYPFEVDELGRSVLERSRERTGLALTSSRSRLRLSEGLALEAVTTSAALPVGRYDVELDRILFEYRPRALLRGRLELGPVRLERPRVVVTLGAKPVRERVAPPRPPTSDTPDLEETKPVLLDQDVSPGSPAPLSRVVFAPSEIRMTSGEFLVGDRFSLRGVDAALARLDYDRRAITALHALTSDGTIAIAEATFGSLRLQNVIASLTSQNGRFTFEPLSFSGVHGDFTGTFAVDFNVIPFRYRSSLVGDPVEIGGLGEGVLRFDAEGFGTESRHLSGSGTLELDPGPIPDFSFTRELHPELAGSAHQGARTDFEVRDNVVRVQGLRFETPTLVLEVEGEIDLEGRLELTLTLHEGERRDTYLLRGSTEAPELTRRD